MTWKHYDSKKRRHGFDIILSIFVIFWEVDDSQFVQCEIGSTMHLLFFPISKPVVYWEIFLDFIK